MKKLVIIPAYNESSTICQIIDELTSTAPDYDYIIINDCSTDDTGHICYTNGYNTVNLPVNLGIGGAVQTGYKFAYTHGYDIAVQLDADGQHNPAYLSEMEKYLLENGCDMVIGSRFLKKEGFQSSALRRVGITYFTSLIKLLSGQTITDPTSGLRMTGKKLIKLFASVYPKDYPEPESLMQALHKGFTVKETPVRMRSRQGGISSISALNSLYYMIKVTMAIIAERIR